VRASINGLTAALVVGVLLGLILTPDGRQWLRRPTLLLGGSANASSAAPAVAAPVVQTAPSSISTSSAPAITPLDQRLQAGQLRIGVIGDSMAEGLYTGLYRGFQSVEGVSVHRFSEVSTGLSRYDYVDVQAKTERQLREQPIDAAVIMFGTNDAQAISINGVVHAFGSPEWRQAYARRIDDLVGLLRASDVAVYWVGLPRMKRATFDARMGVINEVVTARMQALSVPYIDTVALTSGSDGEYEAYLSEGAAGRPRLMRANDGIHMSMAGYLRISAPVLERLRRDAGVDRVDPAPSAPPAT
jgi:hypothetical protein